ncbi:TIGR04283 family arsenosugar biosynthesis glycosyltransferase [soil metagenome]
MVPTLNEAGEIGAALEALQPLRERGAEVIVVDGGSADGTGELAAPLAHRVLTSEPGRARQQNAGAREARGEILLFLHADTRLPPEADALILEGLARSGRGWGRFDVRLSGAHPGLRVVERMISWRSRLTGMASGDQAIFVRRPLFHSVGGFPEIPLMEDLALSRALKRLGPPLCLRERVTTSSRRWERGGIARTILLMWRLRLAYYRGADPAELAERYRAGG